MQPKIMQAMLVDQIFHPTNTSTIIPCLMVSRIRDPNPVQWRSPGNSISPFISPCFLFWREDSLHGKKNLKTLGYQPIELASFSEFSDPGCFGTAQLGNLNIEGWEVQNWVHGWPCSSTTVWAGHKTFWVQLLIQRSLHQIIRKKNTFRNFFLPMKDYHLVCHYLYTYHMLYL